MHRASERTFLVSMFVSFCVALLIDSTISSGMNDFQQIFVDQTTDGIVDEDLPISFVVHGYLASIQNSRKSIECCSQ